MKIVYHSDDCSFDSDNIEVDSYSDFQFTISMFGKHYYLFKNTNILILSYDIKGLQLI